MDTGRPSGQNPTHVEPVDDEDERQARIGGDDQQMVAVLVPMDQVESIRAYNPIAPSTSSYQPPASNRPSLTVPQRTLREPTIELSDDESPGPPSISSPAASQLPTIASQPRHTPRRSDMLVMESDESAGSPTSSSTPAKKLRRESGGSRDGAHQASTRAVAGTDMTAPSTSTPDVPKRKLPSATTRAESDSVKKRVGRKSSDPQSIKTMTPEKRALLEERQKACQLRPEGSLKDQLKKDQTRLADGNNGIAQAVPSSSRRSRSTTPKENTNAGSRSPSEATITLSSRSVSRDSTPAPRRSSPSGEIIPNSSSTVAMDESTAGGSSPIKEDIEHDIKRDIKREIKGEIRGDMPFSGAALSGPATARFTSSVAVPAAYSRIIAPVQPFMAATDKNPARTTGRFISQTIGTLSSTAGNMTPPSIRESFAQQSTPGPSSHPSSGRTFTHGHDHRTPSSSKRLQELAPERFRSGKPDTTAGNTTAGSSKMKERRRVLSSPSTSSDDEAAIDAKPAPRANVANSPPQSGKPSTSAGSSKAKERRRGGASPSASSDEDADMPVKPAPRKRGRPPKKRESTPGKIFDFPDSSEASQGSSSKTPVERSGRKNNRSFSPTSGSKVLSGKKPNTTTANAIASTAKAASSITQPQTTTVSVIPLAKPPKIARAPPSRYRTSASLARYEALRIRDEGLLKHFDLHYPGKSYLLAKKGTVNEYASRDFVKEIEAQNTETLEDWRDRAAEMEEKGEVYVEDFIVGCARFDGEWDEVDKNMDIDIIVKYQGFPRGYWMSYSTADHAEDGLRAIQEFRWRMDILWQTMVAMRKECEEREEDFDTMYPEFFIKKVKKGMQDGYAMDKRVEQRTLLRAREATINACLKMVNLPPIILENWTGDGDDSNAFEFIWTNYVHPSKKVQRALAKADHDLTHRCNDDCPCVGADEVPKDCKCQMTKCTSEMMIANVECAEECKCDVTTCASRVLQRGRQHPLLIIKHPVKGYTMRTAEFLAKGEFVCEYTGDILTAHENSKRAQTYSTDLTDVIVDQEKESNLDVHKKRQAKIGKKTLKKLDKYNNEVDGYYHRAFVNCALLCGNESRYCSHHCRPNMTIMVRYIERINFAFAHFGLFVMKDVNVGDELTWNYHGEAIEDARRKNQPFKSDLLPRCDCKAPDCMIKPWDQCTASDEEVGSDAEDEQSNDSFSDSEDEMTEFEKKQKAEKERMDRLEKRRLSRAEKIAPKEAPKDSSVENVTPPGSPTVN